MKKIPLHTFSLFGILVSGIFSLPAKAQIVYTDVNPDITFSGTYNLDLNNDGIIDFVIQHTSKSINGSGKCKGQNATNNYIRITPKNTNKVLVSSRQLPRRMVANDIIDGSVQASSWNNNLNQLIVSYEFSCTYICFYGGCGYMMVPTTDGQWNTGIGEDGFIGLRLIKNGLSYFGWLRMIISAEGISFTIKDYAFNTVAGQAILAGQSLVEHLGISPISNLSNPFCVGNNFAIPFIISGSFSASNIVTAELSDVTGSFANPVIIGNVVSNLSGTINAAIPGSTPSGYGYQVRVRSSNPVRISYSTPFNTYVQGGIIDNRIVTSADTNLCRNGSVTLTAIYDYPYGDVCTSFQWRLNDNNIPGANSISYSATVAGNYTCVKTNGAGSVTSNTITVFANPIPATIQVNPGPVVCGEYILLSNTGMNGSYQWKLNGNNILGATESSHSPASSGYYSCMVSNTCGSSTSNTIPVSINPPMPDAVITPSGPVATCNETFLLTANSGQGLSYQWYDVGYPYSTYNPKIISGATNSYYAASSTGVYYVKETNSVGCSRQSDYIATLIGNPQPIVYPSSNIVCPGNPINLHAEPAIYISPSNAYSYQWIKDGLNISNATSQNYLAKDPGIYSVKVTLNSGGCSGTSTGVVITNGCNITAKSSTSNELENLALNEQQLEIAPNPASSQTQISFTTSKPGKVLLDVFDISGKLVKIIVDRNFEAGIYQLLLDTKNFNAGIYILKMQAEASVLTKKLVVVK